MAIRQRRGLFRIEYEGATLRENLGLPVPENRWSKNTHVTQSESVGAR